MDYSDKTILDYAEELFRKDDPKCIVHFESVGNPSAKSKLALIYLEGRCHQKVDYDKALRYTANNPNFLARAIEAQIIVFERHADSKTCYKYYCDLMNIHDLKPEHPKVNQVLSDMIIQGHGVEMDFAKAVAINPKLKEQKIFNKALSTVPATLLPAVEENIESQGNITWSTLLTGFHHAQATYEKVERISKEGADFSKGYSERIRAAWKERKYNVGNMLAAQWFSEEQTPDSAYHYLRFGGRNIPEYEHAAEILEVALDQPKNMKCLVGVAREREDWNRLEKCLSSGYADHPMYEYDRGRLDEHKKDIDSACRHYLASVYLNPVTGKYTSESIDALNRAFSLKPELVLDHRDYAEMLLEMKVAKNTCIVTSAMYDCGTEADKARAIELLKQLAPFNYWAANKLFEITGEEQYRELSAKMGVTHGKTSEYFFRFDDPTAKIEANYQDLPPLYQIRALEVLSKRYLYKKMGSDVEPDAGKAADYLTKEIGLCEKYGVSSKFAKARLGLMMYDEKAPCVDEKLMFEYLYPLRSVSPYTLPVAKCLVKGIGTERDIKEAIKVLSASDNPYVRRYLLKLYSEDPEANGDEVKIYSVLKKILTDSEPSDKDLKVLKSITINPDTVDEELSYNDYRNSKFKSLREAGRKATNKRDAIRYYDFARQCGDPISAIMEARIIMSYGLERLAYSILKTSNVDPQEDVYLKIRLEHRVLIDVDQELEKFFNSNLCQ